MTHHEAIGLRCVLENRLAELAARTNSDGVLIESAADEIERRLKASDREVAGAGLEVVARGLREANAALRLIDDGSYGQCVDCGVSISKRRLEALPWAVRCIRCQHAADRRTHSGAARFPLAA